MNVPERGPGFFEIRLEQLKDNTSSHFDIYADVDRKTQSDPSPSDLLLYAKAPYNWTYREINDLCSAGINSLYVREDDRNRFHRYTLMNEAVPEIDHQMEARFRIVQVEEIGARLIETSFLTDIDTVLMDRLRIVADELTSCLQEDPSSILHLKTLADHDLYTYIHSVGVGSLTVAIAISLGVTDRDALKEYALGGLMHDIGKKHVPLNVLNKAGPLTEDEWGTMKRHPEFGLQTLQDFALPNRVMEMVQMHHEKLDGSGYPHGLTKSDIPQHVQIATVADIYSALTTTRCYHRKRSRFEALMFMKHNLRGKISADIFSALVKSLATGDQTESQKTRIA